MSETTETVYQVHLNMPGMSGRGVRFRLLDPHEVRSCEELGAKLAGPDAKFLHMRNAQFHEALCHMVVEVTEEPVLGTRKLDSGEEVARGLDEDGLPWMKVTYSELHTEPHHKAWSKLFGAKDTQALEKLYVTFHEVNPFELNELVGKALPVASGG